MLNIHIDIDQEAQTVTWRVEAGEPDCEVNGWPVHQIDSTLRESRQMAPILHQLGYEHVGCDVAPWPRPHHIEYWARVTGPAKHDDDAGPVLRAD